MTSYTQTINKDNNVIKCKKLWKPSVFIYLHVTLDEHETKRPTNVHNLTMTLISGDVDTIQ